MKRNMELVRKLLLAVEEKPFPIDSDDITVSDFIRPEIDYHFQLLFEAGLLRYVVDASTHDGNKQWLGVSLTWTGHEFLDAARNETVWTEATRLIVSKVGTVTFDVLKTVLSQALLRNLGLP